MAGEVATLRRFTGSSRRGSLVPRLVSGIARRRHQDVEFWCVLLLYLKLCQWLWLCGRSQLEGPFVRQWTGRYGGQPTRTRCITGICVVAVNYRRKQLRFPAALPD